MEYEKIEKKKFEEIKEKIRLGEKGLQIQSNDIIQPIIHNSLGIIHLQCPIYEDWCEGTGCTHNETRFVNSEKESIESICRFGGRDIVIAKVGLIKEEEEKKDE